MNEVALPLTPKAMDEKSPPSGTLLAIIEKAVENPAFDVAKLEKLLDMQERIMTKNAEIAFNQAMARLQPRLPTIRHNAEINHNGKLISSYATYESIDKQIRGLYTEEGFSISFDSRGNPNNTVTYTGTVSHSEGHSRTAEMILPADISGAKNPVQAIGSTITYAKRYLLTMLFNLITTGEDDDGVKGGTEFIELDEAAEIDKALNDVKADKPKFLKYMGVDDVRNIKKSDKLKALKAIEQKRLEGDKKNQPTKQGVTKQ